MRFWVLVSAAVVLAAVAVYRWQQSTATDSLNQLWAPLLSSGKQVLICLPTGAGQHRGALTVAADLAANDAPNAKPASQPAKVTFLEHEMKGENVVFSDALATISIANLLALRSREFWVKLNVLTTLNDLRQGPSVLIGGLDNQWSMQALAPLRFHFGGSDEANYWIADPEHPDNHQWSLNLEQEYAKVTRDYALIARVHSQQAGQPQIIVAGIGMSGTMAAGEFLTDGEQIKALRTRLGRDLRDRDFEIVLSTDVINGMAGAPQIVAVWVRSALNS